MSLPYTSCNLNSTLYDPNPYWISTSYTTSTNYLGNILKQQVVLAQEEISGDVLQINIKKKQFKFDFNL